MSDQAKQPKQSFHIIKRIVAQYAIVSAETKEDADERAEKLPEEAWVTNWKALAFHPSPTGAQILSQLDPNQRHVLVEYDTDWQMGGCSCDYNAFSNGKRKETNRTIYLPYALVEEWGLENAFTLLTNLGALHITYEDMEQFYDAEGTPLPDYDPSPDSYPCTPNELLNQ